MTSIEKFYSSIKKQKHICVGLDSDIKKIPSFLLSEQDPIYTFNKIIIDNTIDFVGAYKFNLAFYECDGSKGIESLLKSIEYLKENIFIIGDGKRSDIGNTSEKYTEAIYKYFKFDSATINPYMGFDSILPFINYKDKLNFVLALTSNKSAYDFEKLKLESGEFVFQNVIRKVKDWNQYSNLGIVFGATQFEELKENISLFDDLAVLLPGVGSQGGDLESVVKLFYRNKKFNFIINSSREIIFKDTSKSFGATAKNQLIVLNKKVESIISKF